jgi:hypothetical protein
VVGRPTDKTVSIEEIYQAAAPGMQGMLQARHLVRRGWHADWPLPNRRNWMRPSRSDFCAYTNMASL